MSALAAGLLAASLQAAEPSDADRRALLAQKARLVEQLLGSARAADVASSGDAARQAALARARAVLADGRAAIGGGDTARAQAFVDEALRLATAAFGGAASAGRDEAVRARNAELRQQVATFRGALASAPPGGRAEGDEPTLQRLDRLVAEADGASAAARHDDAAQALGRAYQLATETLAAVWAGKTITLELKFETPADEFRYESERYASHESLVGLAMAERRPDAAARAAVEQALAQAREVRARADASAAAGDPRGGVTLLEQATGHLLRALQAAGVPTLK